MNWQKYQQMVISWANHRHALYYLAFVAFIDSVFFPISPAIMMVPMMLINPKKSWLYALIIIIFSILGGLLGYAIGFYFYDSLGIGIISLFHGEKYYQNMVDYYDKYGFWVVAIWGFSPIPYKFITIFSGLMKLSLDLFILGSILGRCLRYCLMAGLFYFYGEKINFYAQKFRRYWLKICIFLTLILCVIGGWLLFKPNIF